MTKEECIALLDRYANYNGVEIPNLEGCKEAMLKAVELLSQSSLPSNLDKAAEETAKKYYCSCLEMHNETGICDGCENVKIAFKDGARWRDAQIPKLPDNVGEATEEYAPDLPSYIGNGISIAPESRQDLRDAFKAGAEWMAGQGETFNGYISVKGKRSLIAIEGKSDNKYGDKVIVQIRKK